MTLLGHRRNTPGTEFLKVFKTHAAPGVLKNASFTNDFSPSYWLVASYDMVDESTVHGNKAMVRRFVFHSLISRAIFGET